VTVVEILAAAEQGRVVQISLRMAHRGALTPGRRAELQQAVDAIGFDPERACGFGALGEHIGPRTLTPGPSLVAAGSSAARGGHFSFLHAGQGAGMLQRVFVPVQIFPSHVDDAPSLVVEFQAGKKPEAGKSVADYTRKFAEMIGATYCWELEESAGGERAPTLDFATPEPGELRRFDCAQFALGPPVQRSVRAFTRAEFEDFIAKDPAAQVLLAKRARQERQRSQATSR
jgi:hypothetical protein